MRPTILEYIVRRPGHMSHSRRHRTLADAWRACDIANQVTPGHRVYEVREGGRYRPVRRREG